MLGAVRHGLTGAKHGDTVNMRIHMKPQHSQLSRLLILQATKISSLQSNRRIALEELIQKHSGKLTESERLIQGRVIGISIGILVLILKVPDVLRRRLIKI